MDDMHALPDRGWNMAEITDRSICVVMQERRDLCPGVEQRLDEVAADKTTSACYQSSFAAYFHS